MRMVFHKSVDVHGRYWNGGFESKGSTKRESGEDTAESYVDVTSPAPNLPVVPKRTCALCVLTSQRPCHPDQDSTTTCSKIPKIPSSLTVPRISLVQTRQEQSSHHHHASIFPLCEPNSHCLGFFAPFHSTRTNTNSDGKQHHGEPNNNSTNPPTKSHLFLYCHFLLCIQCGGSR